MKFKPHNLTLKLPKFLYAPLPYIYMATGALALYQLKGVLAWAVGIFLMTAGVTIWLLRRDFRQQNESQKDSPYDDSRTTRPALLAQRNGQPK